MVKKKKRGVSRADAEAAVKTLLRWAGDDPLREGLHETPKRVVNAYSRLVLRILHRSRRVPAPHLRGSRGLR